MIGEKFVPKLMRFGISLEKELLAKFDRHIRKKNYQNRSEAIRDLIREELVKTEWIEGKEVAGAIVLVYDHHKRELVNKLTDIQHDFYKLIISSQHIHYCILPPTVGSWQWPERVMLLMLLGIRYM